MLPAAAALDHEPIYSDSAAFLNGTRPNMYAAGALHSETSLAASFPAEVTWPAWSSFMRMQHACPVLGALSVLTAELAQHICFAGYNASALQASCCTLPDISLLLTNCSTGSSAACACPVKSCSSPGYATMSDAMGHLQAMPTKHSKSVRCSRSDAAPSAAWQHEQASCCSFPQLQM